MRVDYGDENGIVYMGDSTAASTVSGSYSSASESNLSFVMRNRILLINAVEETGPRVGGHAVITNVDRERIKRVYPRARLAKTPAISEELNVM